MWSLSGSKQYVRKLIGERKGSGWLHNVKLGYFEDLMWHVPNSDADNPYNSLISLSSSGAPMKVGALLYFSRTDSFS